MGFLHRLLRGTRPASTADIDRLVVRQLEGRGAELSLPRHVIHFIYFPRETDARDAAGELDQAGYDATVTSPTEEIAEWCVRAEAYRVVGFSTVEGFRAWFEQLAAEYRGEYDGWEAAAKP